VLEDGSKLQLVKDARAYLELPASGEPTFQQKIKISYVCRARASWIDAKNAASLAVLNPSYTPDFLRGLSLQAAVNLQMSTTGPAKTSKKAMQAPTHAHATGTAGRSAAAHQARPAGTEPPQIKNMGTTVVQQFIAAYVLNPDILRVAGNASIHVVRIRHCCSPGDIDYASTLNEIAQN
jgi:hypothetical protein